MLKHFFPLKKHTEEGYARGDHPDCYQYGGNCFEKRSFLYGENTHTLTRDEYLEELQKSLNKEYIGTSWLYIGTFPSKGEKHDPAVDKNIKDAIKKSEEDLVKAIKDITEEKSGTMEQDIKDAIKKSEEDLVKAIEDIAQQSWYDDTKDTIKKRTDALEQSKRVGMFDKKSMETISPVMLIDCDNVIKECENKFRKKFKNIDSKDVKEIYKKLILDVLLEFLTFLTNINEDPKGVFKRLDDFNKHLIFGNPIEKFSTERVRTLLNFVRCMDGSKKIKFIPIGSYVPSSESQKESINYTIYIIQPNAKSIKTGANEPIGVKISINIPILDCKKFYIDYHDICGVHEIDEKDKNIPDVTHYIPDLTHYIPDLTHLMSKISVSMTDKKKTDISIAESYFFVRMLRIALFSYYDDAFLNGPIWIPLKEETRKAIRYHAVMALTIPSKEELTKAMIPPKKELTKAMIPPKKELTKV